MFTSKRQHDEKQLVPPLMVSKQHVNTKSGRLEHWEDKLAYIRHVHQEVEYDSLHADSVIVAIGQKRPTNEGQYFELR